mgnify:FL=1
MNEHMFDLMDLIPDEAYENDPYPDGFDPFDTPEGSGEGVLGWIGETAQAHVLAALLSNTDASHLSGFDRVELLKAHQKLVSHYQGAFYQDISSISDHYFKENGDYELADEATAMEIRAALRMTRRSADREIAFAIDIVHRLPRIASSLRSGDIDVRRARVMTHGTSHLDDEDARQVIDKVIEAAPRLSTGQLAARVRKLCLEVDPEDAKHRFESALEERRVVSEPTVDATTHLIIENGSPELVAEAKAHINSIAKSLRSPEEERTMDQLRADVSLALLSGKMCYKPTGRGVTDIHVDLTTLAELDENPGELAGYGPVIADIARQVAESQPKAEWRYTVTDPDTEQVVANGITRRRPTAWQRRAVEAHNRTCVYPCCRMPSRQCDLDHIQPYSEGGPTDVANLGPDCRHDHVCLHRHGWTYRPLPGGDYLWTSPTGQRYTTSGLPPPQAA